MQAELRTLGYVVLTQAELVKLVERTVAQTKAAVKNPQNEAVDPTKVLQGLLSPPSVLMAAEAAINPDEAGGPRPLPE